MALDIVDSQLAEVQVHYPDARMETVPDGQRLLTVPGVGVGPGWNKTQTTVRILVPTGFPHVKPDCFYTEAELRLAAGDPASSAPQTVFGATYRWFSWHLQDWNPASGTLQKYVAFCRRRLQEAR
jgi:hypothetical protein